MNLTITQPLGCWLRVVLGLGIVCAVFWWPVYYIRYHIPPCVDDRSGMVLASVGPFVLTGAVYAMSGALGVWRNTRSLSRLNQARWRFAAFILLVPAFLPVLFLFLGGGCSMFLWSL
jgi:hypothetical protein